MGIYRRATGLARLANARTCAHYAKLVVWVGILICLDQAIHISTNETVTAMSPIVLFMAIFLFMSASERCSPTFFTHFMGFAEPGTTFLTQWIALIFFVYTVSLPATLQGNTTIDIVGYVGSLVMGSVMQSVGTAFFVRACACAYKREGARQGSVMSMPRITGLNKGSTTPVTELVNPMANIPEEEEVSPVDKEEVEGGARMRNVSFQSYDAPTLKPQQLKKANSHMVVPANRTSELEPERHSIALFSRHSMQVFAKNLTASATTKETDRLSMWPVGMGDAFIDALPGTTMQHEEDPRAENVKNLLRDELYNGQTKLIPHLVNVLERDFPNDGSVHVFLDEMQNLYGDSIIGSRRDEDEENADVPAEPSPAKTESQMEIKVQILSFDDVLEIFRWLSLAVAILFFFVQSSPWPFPYPYIWIFQFSMTIVIFLSMTQKRGKLLGWVHPKILFILQPALLVIIGLMVVAGGTWPEGFLNGLAAYRFRISSSAASTIYSRDFWKGVGPGEVFGILLNPAIGILAFPTYAAMKSMGSTFGTRLPVMIFGSIFSAVLSFFCQAVLAFLLISSKEISLSILSHSTSTAVAVGFASILCSSGTCASGDIVSTACIATGVGQMLFGPKLLDMFGIKDEMARGIAIGTSGMALGTVGLKLNGEDTAAGIASLAYAAFAVVNAVLVVISPFITMITTLAARCIYCN